MPAQMAWDTALAVLASLGGGGVIVLGLSTWIGKIWAGRIMAGEMKRHNLDIESLKATLALEAESYRARLRKSELVFQKEFDAANALANIVSTIESSYSDPWMDDENDFLEHVGSTRGRIATLLESYLSNYSAIIPRQIRVDLRSARTLCVQASADEVPGGVTLDDAGRYCWDRISLAELALIEHVRAQSA